jgi:hypothetical protein
MHACARASLGPCRLLHTSMRGAAHPRCRLVARRMPTHSLTHTHTHTHAHAHARAHTRTHARHQQVVVAATHRTPAFLGAPVVPRCPPSARAARAARPRHSASSGGARRGAVLRPAAAARAPAVGVQANLFSRLVRVVRAYVSNFTEQFEDPGAPRWCGVTVLLAVCCGVLWAREPVGLQACLRRRVGHACH